MTDPTDREQTIRGLRELADFLEANPDVPVPPFEKDITFHVRGATDDAERAEVERIAAILGVSPSGTSHYRAELSFSGRVVYQAVAITKQSMAEWDAERSYRGAVRPAEVAS